MRELRVIGVTPDSAHIVCVDTESGQKFRLPADDKLRAAARGDLARFGQIEIEMEATMRPRDIQARIRAGASVEQVTQESGMPVSRVERFAYPVLLERARAAELAQKAHPIRPDGPAVEILVDVVTAAFTARGHTLDNAEWDAWKDEKGFWVAQLQWQNGRSEIAAHWRYQPDAHGGSVSPLDDPATDLIDPDFGRALRGLASILPVESEPAAAPEPVAEPRREPARAAAVDDYYEQRAVAAGGTTALPATATPLAPGSARPGGTALPAGTPAASAPAETYRPPADSYRPPAETYPAPAEPARPAAPRPAPAPAAAPPPAPAPAAELPPTPAETAAPEPVPPAPEPVPAAVESEPAPLAAAPAAPAPEQQPEPVAAEPVREPEVATAPAEAAAAPAVAETPAAPADTPEAPAAEPAAETSETEPAAAKPAAKKPPAKATKAAARTKRGKAPMPSWEDVLLGVRSSGH
ncbi:septation protein SepH [Nocardia sp. NPDC004568]|uniref:septation protein SepH n=1 Tax=Nocardia sp. NPDC004568 TaxID=3154551 RepID=UPI0033BDB130